MRAGATFLALALFAFALLAFALPAGAEEPGDEPPFAQVGFSPGLPDFSPLTKLGLVGPRMVAISAPSDFEGAPDPVLVLVEGRKDGEPGQWLLQYYAEGGTSLRRLPMVLAGGESIKMLLSLEKGGPLDAELELEVDGDRVGYRLSPREQTLLPGQPIPDFRVADLDGETLDGAAWRGRWTLVDWWAISCAPCVASIPKLNRLKEKLADLPIRFVAVAMETPEALAPFLEKHPFAFEQHVAVEGTLEVFGTTFPRTVLLDPSGVVRRDWLGFQDPAKLESELRAAIEAGR